MEYRWITIDDEYLCNGDSKYEKQKKQYSEDGTVWYDVEPLEVKRGDIIERYSVDCGYVAGTVIRPYSVITDKYFVEYCPLPKNYDLSEIRPFYNVGEEIWLIPLIGTALYEELLQQVNDNEVTPENSTLLLKIYPYLSFAICYEALAFISFHFSATGITAGFSENSRSVNINDINFISTTLRNQIELMKKILRKFLNDNADLYPLYRADNTPCDCQCEKGDEWLWNYYFGDGVINKYDWERWLLSCMLQKDKPLPYAQAYSTPRRPIDIR